MKKRISFKKSAAVTLTAAMLLGNCGVALAEESAETGYTGAPYQTVELDESDPDYYTALLEAGIYNYKMVRNYPTLYESDAWDNAQTVGNLLLSIDAENMTDTDKENVVAMAEAVAALSDSQVKDFEGIDGEVLYIWGDDMPVTTENVEEGFTLDSYDNSDFSPFLVPYLLEDQSEAKGTLIILSGGGNTTRSNPNEAYKVAPAFVELGYNCFVLQRRVDPYNETDIVLDLQRSIRYIKYYAEEWGLDLEGTLLGAAGFSGGAGNLMEQINNFYGDITPDQFDTDYVCDEIDAVNSDLDVAMPIYGGDLLDTENTAIPHLFMAVGADDDYDYMIVTAVERLQQTLTDETYSYVEAELHIYGLNGHGFGAGNAGTSSMLWIESADLFMQKVMGYAEVDYEGEIPEEYVLTQDILVDWFPIGETNVNVYTNADQSKVLFTFFGWGDNIMVEGILINNTVADVTYDSVGYFAGDAAAMWELVDPSAWVSVE